MDSDIGIADIGFRRVGFVVIKQLARCIQRAATVPDSFAFSEVCHYLGVVVDSLRHKQVRGARVMHADLSIQPISISQQMPTRINVG